MKSSSQSHLLSFIFSLLFVILVVESASIREVLTQKRSMLQNIKDAQNYMLTMMDAAKTLASPSDQTIANQLIQEQQAKLQKTKVIEQKLSFELGLLETKCNISVGENCNQVIPSNCTVGWFGSNCSIPICFGYLPGDSNICGGHGTCVKPNTCSCQVGWTGSSCETNSYIATVSSVASSPSPQTTATIVGDNLVGRKWSNGEVAASCNQYRNPLPGYQYEGATGDGVYLIKTSTTLKVWCDMNSNGGGWTLVVAQYENDAIGNWAQGLTANYDPTLQSKKSFVIDSNLIPTHTYTAFGKDFVATFVDYFAFTYTTGDIPNTEVFGVKSNAYYRIHRNVNNYYDDHHPYGVLNSVPQWKNALTCSKSTAKYYWAFSPFATNPSSRGFAIGGNLLDFAVDSFAWTVWVK